MQVYQSKQIKDIFPRDNTRKSSYANYDLNEATKILKENGQVSAMIYLTKNSDITIEGAKNIIMKIKKLENIT